VDKKKIFQKPTCGLEISIGQTKFYWPWAIVPPLTSNTENVNVDEKQKVHVLFISTKKMKYWQSSKHGLEISICCFYFMLQL
jgi:hypothetical protein